MSLTVTEKGYCADAASGQLDLNNPLIKHDLENPTAPKSAIGYIVEALRLRREKGLKAFTVMSCDCSAAIFFAPKRDKFCTARRCQKDTFCTVQK